MTADIVDAFEVLSCINGTETYFNVNTSDPSDLVNFIFKLSCILFIETFIPHPEWLLGGKHLCPKANTIFV